MQRAAMVTQQCRVPYVGSHSPWALGDAVLIDLIGIVPCDDFGNGVWQIVAASGSCIQTGSPPAYCMAVCLPYQQHQAHLHLLHRTA
jgi:hypothetical protein